MTEPGKRDLIEESREACADALIRAAVLQLMAEKGEEMAKEMELGSEEFPLEELDAMVERARPRLLREADREFRRQRTRAFLRETLPRTLRVAACLIAVLSVSAVTALAASPAARVYLGGLLLSIEKEYTVVHFASPASSDAVAPEDWRGAYFPSYIPEGFKLSDMYRGEWSPYSVMYTDTNEKALYFMESDIGSGDGMRFDTEDANIKWIQLNGWPAMLAEKEGKVKLVWSLSDHWFYLSFDGSKQEAIKIAESIVKIK